MSNEVAEKNNSNQIKILELFLGALTNRSQIDDLVEAYTQIQCRTKESDAKPTPCGYSFAKENGFF